LKGVADVRFGSEGDICTAISDVRFTPKCDHKSGHPHKGMSALPSKADIRGREPPMNKEAAAAFSSLEVLLW
jgi:hypothetical protein